MLTSPEQRSVPLEAFLGRRGLPARDAVACQLGNSGPGDEPPSAESADRSAASPAPSTGQPPNGMWVLNQALNGGRIAACMAAAWRRVSSSNPTAKSATLGTVGLVRAFVIARGQLIADEIANPELDGVSGVMIDRLQDGMGKPIDDRVMARLRRSRLPSGRMEANFRAAAPASANSLLRPISRGSTSIATVWPSDRRRARNWPK